MVRERRLGDGEERLQVADAHLTRLPAQHIDDHADSGSESALPILLSVVTAVADNSTSTWAQQPVPRARRGSKSSTGTFTNVNVAGSSTITNIELQSASRYQTEEVSTLARSRKGGLPGLAAAGLARRQRKRERRSATPTGFLVYENRGRTTGPTVHPGSRLSARVRDGIRTRDLPDHNLTDPRHVSSVTHGGVMLGALSSLRSRWFRTTDRTMARLAWAARRQHPARRP